MFKKIIMLVLALTFTISAVGCGNSGSEYIEYTVTQASQTGEVAYNGKTLSATTVKFAEAETPEKVYALFGNTATGKTDVSFLGRVQIVDGNVVIGLKVGTKPRMAGIYVKGFGYYFISTAQLVAGEYAVCLSNVPYGTFQMSVFSIVEDDFIVGTDSLSFTREQALLLEGEKENDYTLEVGKLLLDGQGYQSLVDTSFVVAKNSVLNFGEITATVQGDAGVTLGVYGSMAGDISKATYIYAGIKAGKATVIQYSMGVASVLGETVIANYSTSESYQIGANVVSTATDDTRKTDVVLSVNGEALVTVNKTVEANKNVGFMCLENGAKISSIAIPPCSLDEYKAYAKAQFDNLVQVEFYEEYITGLTTSYIDKVTKTYNDATKYTFVSREYNKAVKAINTATDIENATTLYNKHYALLNAEVLESYKEDIESSLKTMSENWYSIMFYDETVKNFPYQDKNGDGRKDVTIKYNSGAEEYFNMGLDGIDGETFDYRWWIPKPLRTPNILTSAHKEIAKCNSKDVLKMMYEEYYDAVLRSVCQKVIEEYHAIKCTEEYGLLWSDCWGYNNIAIENPDRGLPPLVYNGPVTEYKGEVFGISDETAIRLSPCYYAESEGAQGILGERSIFELFNYQMNIIKNAQLPQQNS